MLLAFDFGTKNIGVAASQSAISQPEELKPVAANNGVPRWTTIDQYVNDWQPRKLLVGLPLNMDGSEQEMTRRARKFGNRLHDRYHLKVEFIDERLSTHAAKERAFDRGHHGRFNQKPIDSVAAAVLFERYWASQ